AWFARYEEMLGGAIEGSVAILSQLRANHVRLYALSNWSAETFPFARKRFEFLKWFHGLLLSGEAGLMKPDPRLFQMLFDRYAIDPTDAIYIDDHSSNVEAARRLGMRAIHFTDPHSLRRQLDRFELPVS